MPHSLALELQHRSPCVLPTPASHTPGPGQDGAPALLLLGFGWPEHSELCWQPSG